MLQILINGLPKQLLEPVEGEVDTISIQKHPFVQIPIDASTASVVKAWLKDLVSRCNGLISYNGTLMYREDCV